MILDNEVDGNRTCLSNALKSPPTIVSYSMNVKQHFLYQKHYKISVVSDGNLAHPFSTLFG